MVYLASIYLLNTHAFTSAVIFISARDFISSPAYPSGVAFGQASLRDGVVPRLAAGDHWRHLPADSGGSVRARLARDAD